MAFQYLKYNLLLLLGFAVALFLMDRMGTRFDTVVYIGMIFVFAICYFSLKGLRAGIKQYRTSVSSSLSTLLPASLNGLFFLFSAGFILRLLWDVISSLMG